MDRKWISANRLSKEYEIGVKEFVEFAVKNAKDPNRVVCPCLKCCFGKRVREDELEGHLVCNGIDQSYTCWIRHGEKKKETLILRIVRHMLQLTSIQIHMSRTELMRLQKQLKKIFEIVLKCLKVC